MNILVVLVVICISLVSDVKSVPDEAFDCYMCSGDGCQRTSPARDSCPSGQQCYKMEVRRDTDVDSPFIIKGCTNDQTFWKRSCFDDCKDNQQFGVETARICTYCCDDVLCNSGIKTTTGVYGILFAFVTLAFMMLL
jgi:hypothetical protein